MAEAAFVVLIVIFPLLGGAMRRWLALLFPVIGWPLFYVGLNRDWWGHGTGDGWQYVALLMTTIGVVTTALALALSRAVGRRRRRPE